MQDRNKKKKRHFCYVFDLNVSQGTLIRHRIPLTPGTVQRELQSFPWPCAFPLPFPQAQSTSFPPFCSIICFSQHTAQPGSQATSPGRWVHGLFGSLGLPKDPQKPQAALSACSCPNSGVPVLREQQRRTQISKAAQGTHGESKHPLLIQLFPPPFFFSPQKAVPATPAAIARPRQCHGRLPGGVSEAGEDRGGHLWRGVQGSQQAHGATGGPQEDPPGLVSGAKPQPWGCHGTAQHGAHPARHGARPTAASARWQQGAEAKAGEGKASGSSGDSGAICGAMAAS